MIRHGRHVPSQCPKQKHFPPVLVAIFNISGGNEHAIFVMAAMFLATVLNRGSHPPPAGNIKKWVLIPGGNASV